MYLYNLVLLDLTWREVVADIPVDATALVLYAVCLLLGFIVWMGSRPKPGRTSVPIAPAPEESVPYVTAGERETAAVADSGVSSRHRNARKRRRDSNGITWIIG